MKNVDNYQNNNHSLLLILKMGGLFDEKIDNTNSASHKYSNKHRCISILCPVALTWMNMEAASMGPWI